MQVHERPHKLFVFCADALDPSARGPSTAGHIWFYSPELGDLGYCSREHKIIGEGKFSRDDSDVYHAYDCIAELDLNLLQFAELKRVYETCEADPSYKTYNAFTNSCVDFVIKTLRRIGFQPAVPGDGWILPMLNRRALEQLHEQIN